MPLTHLTIDVPDLGDNTKTLDVEGAIAVGEKVEVTLTGLPEGVDPSADELRLRVLGPMGEDVAIHGDWEEDDGGNRPVYTTTLNLATLQAYHLFFPPVPFPPPRAPRPPMPVPTPISPEGYDPVAAAAFARPAQSVPVRFVLELREKQDEDSSDPDELDASLIGTANVRLGYWPVDWRTATLIDLANGRVYSKAEVDALIEEHTVSAEDRAKWNAKYDKPSSGIPKSDFASDVQASLGKADTALQEHQDITGKADLVDGKVPSSELPSYVDDVLEYASLSAFPATGESGKIYVALDTNKTYRWSGTQYTEIAKSVDVVAPSTSASDSGKAADAKATGDALAGKASTADATLTERSGFTDWEFSWTDPEIENANVTWDYILNPNKWTVVVNGGEYLIYSGNSDPNTTKVVVSAPNEGTIVCTRDKKTGYQLGSQTTKPLAKASDLATHEADSTKHITSAERTAWNGKQNALTQSQLNNIAAVPNKAASTALADAFTAKEYAVGDLVTYNGLLYRCKSAYTATAQSTKPADDTTHWEAAIVAVLLEDKLDIYDGEAYGLTLMGHGTKERWLNFYGSGYADGFDEDGIYSGNDRICWVFGQGDTAFATRSDIAPTYDSTASHAYVVDQLVAYGEGSGTMLKLYRCTTAHTSDVWVAANWTPATVEDALAAIRAAIPAPITVDSSMSTSSTNPVQNKVVKTAIDGRVPWANAAKNAVTIGTRSGIVGASSLAQGDTCKASDNYAHAEGYHTTASNPQAHAEGNDTTASNANAHAEGFETTASGNTAHAEGSGTTAAGNISHAEGLSTYAAGRPSHAEGSETTAAGIASHADGYRAVTAASGNGSGASTPHDYAFAWQGVSTGGYYRSHGAGTFNINPVPASGSTDPATGFWIGEKKLPEVIAQNTNYLAYASTTTLAPETAVYRSSLASDGTFPTVDATAIPTAAAYYQFELELSVPSAVPSTITGPTGWTWLDGHGLPDPADLSGGETICISVRLDCTARTFLASVWRVA